jgi:hypothetical protein
MQGMNWAEAMVAIVGDIQVARHVHCQTARAVEAVGCHTPALGGTVRGGRLVADPTELEPGSETSSKGGRDATAQ